MNFLVNPGVSDRSKVEFVEVGLVKPYPNNPRTHSKKQIRQIGASIRQFGWTNPILIDGTNGVIAGHGRLAAAKELGLTVVPVLRIEHMSEAEKRAYVVADNKLAENAGWDADLLRIELQGLEELDIEFDLEVTGFETGEIDVLLNTDTVPDADEPVPLPDTELKRFRGREICG
ncbi:ParB/Srx family N-terminal domain-containing protein [Ruegeria sp. SCPT10]|uniref:ParB/Srx family N-terminal domain-containing protein n=1 Tax=Ruegeria sp. SCP10 TaxID=3141377 RepID=UPI0033396AC5